MYFEDVKTKKTYLHGFEQRTKIYLKKKKKYQEIYQKEKKISKRKKKTTKKVVPRNSFFPLVLRPSWIW